MTLFSIPHLPSKLVPLIYRAVPPIELGIGVGLIFAFDIAKAAALALLLSFSFLALLVMRAKLKVPCNCFGPGNRVFSAGTILQNLGLMALVCAGIPIKHAEEVPFVSLSAAFVLVAVLSLATFWNNRKVVRELRVLNAL